MTSAPDVAAPRATRTPQTGIITSNRLRRQKFTTSQYDCRRGLSLQGVEIGSDVARVTVIECHWAWHCPQRQLADCATTRVGGHGPAPTPAFSKRLPTLAGRCGRSRAQNPRHARLGVQPNGCGSQKNHLSKHIRSFMIYRAPGTLVLRRSPASPSRSARSASPTASRRRSETGILFVGPASAPRTHA